MNQGSQADVVERSSEDAAVRVRGIRKTYGSGSVRKKGELVAAVDMVDLDVRPGELLVLLGPSGCGKTTLLRSIAGLERPDSGVVHIAGKKVYDSDSGVFLPPERRNIGMMFQSYALWPHMSVADNVAFPLRSRGIGVEEIAQRVSAQLELLGVGGLERRYPSELSGGQQQRVALARALVAEPSVLLFDEPLSNVDARVRRRLRAQLRVLKRETGFAGIYVTHDQEEAMELADTLAVMGEGRIQQIGSTRDVYRRPSNLYVGDFLGELNRVPAQITSHSSVTDSPAAVTVSTPIGEFAATTREQGVRVGADGFLLLRPEDLTVSSAADGSDPRAVGRVLEVVYYGTFTEFIVEIGALKLQVRNAGGDHDGLRIGDPVVVHVGAADPMWLAK